jgi:hypothetical protein
MMIALRDGEPDADVLTLSTPVADFWENVGGLVRAGHVSLPLAYQYLGAACQTTWNLLEPHVRGVQATEGAAVWSDFEWLAAQCVRLRKASGADDGTVTREAFAARAPGNIASLRQSILDFEAMRTVTMASAEVAPGTPEPLSEVHAPPTKQGTNPPARRMAQSTE